MSSKVAKVLVVLCAAAGCAPSASDVGEVAQAQQDEDLPGKKQQGDSLRGTGLTSSGDLVSFDYDLHVSTGLQYLYLDKGKLIRVIFSTDPGPGNPPGGGSGGQNARELLAPHAANNGDAVIGARVTAHTAAGATESVYIVNSLPLQYHPESLVYDVRRGSASGPSICPGTGTDTYAIALRGTWDAQGYHVNDNDHFTF